MAVKFFGQFLVEQGIVSREALLDAIALQESTNLKFGEVAKNLGILGEADIEKVHAAQRSEDLRFGDMALKLGLLSQEQMDEILTKQKNNHLYIGEALVKVGALDDASLQKHLAAFKADQAIYQQDKVVLPAALDSTALWEMVVDLSYKMLTRVAQLTFRPGEAKVVRELPANDTIATMEFTGSVSGTYVLSVSAPIRDQIARAVFNQTDVSSEPLEVLEDTVMEYVNIVCGNIAAKAAQMGKQMDILPPALFNGPGNMSVPDGYVGLLFPICLADGEKVEFAIFV